MFFKRGFVITFILLLTISALLSGCSGGEKASSDGKVTLNFWSAISPGTEEERKTNELIKKFEKEHPNIIIKTQVITYDMLHDKLVAAISANDAPDLSWGLSEWFGELNQMGALQDLTPYINKWKDKDEIYPNVMKALTYEGKVTALPQYLGIRALLYHENMLKESGMASPPKTWDELIDAGTKIKKATGKEAFGIAGSGVRAPQELLAYLASNNVKIAEKQKDGKFKNTWQDNPDELNRVAEVFSFYKQLLDKGVIKNDAKSWGWQEEDTNFSLGQYAMVVNGPWIQDREKESPETMKDVKIAPPPFNEKPATFLEISPLYLYKGSKHPKETWEFASYILSEEWQKSVRATNSPRKDVVSNSQWGKGFTALTETGVTYPEVSLGGITKNMEDSLAKALLEKENPKKVAEWLSKSINQSLQKNGQLSN
ncbi:sugar ABC transporter substrate-binding protein [Fictibacillus enclensis]|uniref:ABC transporter substrate-binding protein n=1 Tax=Fictibacillus enclensis TaxID=1017270 RepID=UPI0025A1A172|nr:sugar ABC transporter substrate-binding protein [Fictibacillus enclensis]MDM5336641.1 sugar ABC transporter substrate-binding protein [Fictibacillus enclensis]